MWKLFLGSLFIVGANWRKIKLFSLGIHVQKCGRYIVRVDFCKPVSVCTWLTHFELGPAQWMQRQVEHKVQFGILPNLLMHDNECMINLVRSHFLDCWWPCDAKKHNTKKPPKVPKTHKKGSILPLQTFGVNVNPEWEGILKRVKMTAGIVQNTLYFQLSTDVFKTYFQKLVSQATKLLNYTPIYKAATDLIFCSRQIWGKMKL
jgi:hypothetical protein